MAADLALAAKVVSTVAQNKGVRKIVIGLLSAGILLLVLPGIFLCTVLTGMITSIAPPKEDLSANLYYQVKEELREELLLINDLDVSYPLAICCLTYGGPMENQREIRSFLQRYFIREEDREDAEGNSHTITRFLYEDEIKLLMERPPFSFSEEDLEFVAFATDFEWEEESPPSSWHGKYPLPMEGGITSRYGARIDPVTMRPGDFHRGLDIRGKWHDSIRSIADGTVYKVNLGKSSWGNYVMVRCDTEDGTFYTLSAHMSKIFVKAGDQVVQGQVLGLEGGDQKSDPNPGNTTGHHLHFEIWKTADSHSHTDPYPFLY